MASLWPILACSQCSSSRLKRTKEGVKCTSCSTFFEDTQRRQPDLRLRREKEVSVNFVLSNHYYRPDEKLFHELPLNSNLQNHANHARFLSKEMASHIPHPSSKTSMMLD